MAVASPSFTGFRPEAVEFLAELAANNERAWFQPRNGECCRTGALLRIDRTLDFEERADAKS